MVLSFTQLQKVSATLIPPAPMPCTTQWRRKGAPGGRGRHFKGDGTSLTKN